MKNGKQKEEKREGKRNMIMLSYSSTYDVISPDTTFSISSGRAADYTTNRNL